MLAAGGGRSANERAAFERLAPVAAILPDLDTWSAADRRALATGGPVRASNLAGSSKAVLATALAEDLSAPVLVLTASTETAETWATDLEALTGETGVRQTVS